MSNHLAVEAANWRKCRQPTCICRQTSGRFNLADWTGRFDLPIRPIFKQCGSHYKCALIPG